MLDSTARWRSFGGVPSETKQLSTSGLLVSPTVLPPSGVSKWCLTLTAPERERRDCFLFPASV